MPWQEATKVSLRRKFVALAVEEGQRVEFSVTKGPKGMQAESVRVL